MVGLSGILDIGLVENLYMIKDKLIGWKKTVSTLKDKLIKMTKEVYGRFNDYSISPKIRQIY